MNIIIDNRETDLIKLLNNNNYNFATSNLDVGDIQFKNNDEIVYIIERKTVNDLGIN